MDYDLHPFPPEREIVVDAGYLGTGRHIIYALVELDVTRARELLRAASATEGRALSFTAFLAASLARRSRLMPGSRPTATGAAGWSSIMMSMWSSW